jgi:hypothetical protein
MKGFSMAFFRTQSVGQQPENRKKLSENRRMNGSTYRRSLRMENLESRDLLSAAGVNEVAALQPTTSAAIIAYDTIGLYNPDKGTFYLKNANEAGPANNTFVYGPGDNEWIPLVGDWEGDGIDTAGLYAPRSSTFYLRYSNDAGYANLTFTFGTPLAGWLPIVGDWNGDGIETIGLYDQTTSTFRLKNSNTSGSADVTFVYGPAGTDWLPVAGAWIGGQADTIGLYNPTTSKFYLRNSNTSGYADNTFNYGPAGANWLPITGDWLSIGIDTIGLYNPTKSTFYLRYSNSGGFANSTFTYGPAASGWLPLAGDWRSPTSEFLTAENSAANATDVPSLLESDLQPAIRAAVERWAAIGLNASQLEKLQNTRFVVADLQDAYLGKAQSNVIYLDANAAGHGWFVDSTPMDDNEFSHSIGNHSLQTLDPLAVDRIDLLSVVEHELGHIAGLGDLEASADNVMCGVLGTGVRRIL